MICTLFCVLYNLLEIKVTLHKNNNNCEVINKVTYIYTKTQNLLTQLKELKGQTSVTDKAEKITNSLAG